MRSIIQSFVVLTIILSLTNCTTYVDPDGTASATTTTTTRTTADPYVPGAAVTTERTTTRY